MATMYYYLKDTPITSSAANYREYLKDPAVAMVFAFLCHSVSGTPCRVLYSTVYGDDLQLAANEVATMDSLRPLRKEQLMQVGCRVQTEYGFRFASKDRTKVKDEYLTSASEDSTSEKGLFRLYAGDPFTTAKVVIWQVKNECAFVLVCELDENRLLAESLLNTLTRLTSELVTSHEQKIAEITLKAEKMTAILHQFLPNGQLQFMNHKVVAQYEKQLEKILAIK